MHANTITVPANYDRFYLGYLETSLLRYTGESQDLVGPACADPGIFARGGGGRPGPTARKQLWQRFIDLFFTPQLFFCYLYLY